MSDTDFDTLFDDKARLLYLLVLTAKITIVFH